MRLRRGPDTSDGADVPDADTDVRTEAGPRRAPIAPKGRATPKRRESEGRRGPVSAPRTRKEALARQRQLDTRSRTSPAAKPTSVAERRAAMRRGDPAFLPRRDQGDTRRLARDYVDSRRMASNYLLLLFPLLFLSFVIRPAQLIILVVFLGFVAEWIVTGKRVRKLAVERFGAADGSNLSIGFYAGSRAYLPRKWRMPAPQRQLGDEI